MFALPPEAGDPDFAALFEYWCRQAPPGRLPGRQHLDPIDMPRDVLPRVVLFDVLPSTEGPLFRVRLAGTKVVQMLGREPRGAMLHQLGLAEADSLASALKAAVTSGAPVIYSAPVILPSRRHLWARRLGLPLARDGVTVDMVLGTYVLRDAAAAGPPGLVVFERLRTPQRASAAG